MLRTGAAGAGQPAAQHRPDARTARCREEAYERLLPVGQWLAQNGEAVYGQVDRTAEPAWSGCPPGSGRSRATRPTTGATAGPAASWPSAGCRRRCSARRCWRPAGDPRVRADREPPGAPRPARDQPGRDRGRSCHQARVRLGPAPGVRHGLRIAGRRCWVTFLDLPMEQLHTSDCPWSRFHRCPDRDIVDFEII